MSGYLIHELSTQQLSQMRKIKITQYLLTCQALRGYWRGLVLGVPSRMDLDGQGEVR
jgi:hypothetical protein